ncbi:MAG: beta-propeller domain-containing protein, partial [archaeon]
MKTKSTIPAGPITLIGAILILGAVAVLWWGPGAGLGNTPIPPGTMVPSPDLDLLIGKPLPRFTSESDIIAQFKAAESLGPGGYLRGASQNDAVNVGAPTMAEGGSDSKSTRPSPSYTGTNVQVEGVDEADIVKTDGEYIYAFYKTHVKIVRAYPAEDAQVVATISLDDMYPRDMFINGNKLIVFGTEYTGGGYYPSPYTKMAGGMGFMPPYWGSPLSIVRVYDLSIIEEPVQVKEYAFRGTHVSSRMMGENVYFVLTTYPEYRLLNGEKGEDEESIIPPYYEDGESRILATPTEIGYIPPVYAQSFITVASVDVDSLKLTKETMVGSAETVYASEDHLYLAHTQYYDPADWPRIMEGSVDTSIAPMPYVQSQVKTVISKFALKDGRISFEGQGKVLGRLLNQFSMDEWDDHFRIATTTDAVWGSVWNSDGKPEKEGANHVYVLDEDMDVVGSLEDLAPGEQIYSARFMGERAYLVTFKQVDPLFVLDLSSHEFPQVLGKLKIPGYSNYLHPLDDTHILGIGKDAEVSKNDTAYYLGMKLAVFDVEDVENPKQVHSIVVGARGTDSYALQDHKAFLYDSEKQLLVLPIYLYELDESQQNQIDQPEWQTWPEYGVPTFQGAFVYKVDLESGFEELGRITHIDKEIDLKSGYYYDYSYQVKRS